MKKGRRRIYGTDAERKAASRARKREGKKKRVFIFLGDKWLEEDNYETIEASSNNLDGIMEFLDKYNVIGYSSFGNEIEKDQCLEYLREREDVEVVMV